ncbi:sigma-70 family RNA polymerase sigma factor [Streptomyces sp. NPDC001941]|uniref:RNA polymerase sigma factor n=1 Tax=Streptomyces sp. NPDC001941 TaxID=3154659 RepID=UPI003316E630
MTGSQSGDPADHATREPRDMLPHAFWAFHELYHRAYYEYARVQLGNATDARDLVDRVFTHIGFIWRSITAEENLGAYAWALLKERVDSELTAQGRDPAAAETLAFHRAIGAATGPLLDDFRRQFKAQVSELESSVGLFAAMARLPERQFDVMVLNYALGFSTGRTALAMGISEATVRSTRRTAKSRLAADLKLDVGADADDEE